MVGGGVWQATGSHSDEFSDDLYNDEERTLIAKVPSTAVDGKSRSLAGYLLQAIELAAFLLAILFLTLAMIKSHTSGTAIIQEWDLFSSGIASLILALISMSARHMRPFLRVFFVFYFLKYTLLKTFFFAYDSAYPLMDEGSGTLKDVFLLHFRTETPIAWALTVAAYLISLIPQVKAFCDIADRWVQSTDTHTVNCRIPCVGAWKYKIKMSRHASLFIAGLVAINQSYIVTTKAQSFFMRQFGEALQLKDQELLIKCTGGYVCSYGLALGSLYLRELLRERLLISWNEWHTCDLSSFWLTDGLFYRLSLHGAAAGVDNPDERIQTDVWQFNKNSVRVAFELLAALERIYAFSCVLWRVNGISVDGYFIYAAAAFAGVNLLVCTGVFGRGLTKYTAESKILEGNFRFYLMRVKEYAEQIAFLGGGLAEHGYLSAAMTALLVNDTRRTLYKAGVHYSQRIEDVGFLDRYYFLLMAPIYFYSDITYGTVISVRVAFLNLVGGLNVFGKHYQKVVRLVVSLARLSAFDTELRTIAAAEEATLSVVRSSNYSDINVKASIALPSETCLGNVELMFRKHKWVLITGPSGGGKSTLLRCIAGVWEYGEGVIKLPEEDRVFLLPQRPYIPEGDLKTVISYPTSPEDVSDKKVRKILSLMGLSSLKNELATNVVWAHRLSGGEQQKISLARALLIRPAWLILDEATAALDEESEEQMYAVLRKYLPTSTVISISHRLTLKAYHDRHIALKRNVCNDIMQFVDVTD